MVSSGVEYVPGVACSVANVVAKEVFVASALFPPVH